VLVALACLLALAPGARAARGMEVAVQDDPMFVANTESGRQLALLRARELGATRIRVNLAWSQVVVKHQRESARPPDRVEYDWSLYDPLVNATRTTDIAVQFALTGPAPAFATGDGKISTYAPKAAYYRDFVRAAAEHFKGGVDRYSIWNEPNYVSWLAPLKRAPKLYRELYVNAYAAIKSVDPKATVLIAETSPYKIVKGKKHRQFSTAPIEFLRQMTCSNRSLTRARCGGLKADGYAHHPYDFDHKPTYRYPGKDNATLASLGNLTHALDRMARSGALRTPRGRRLDLYLTEYGFFTSGKRRTVESRRAKYLPQAFGMAQRNPRVKEMLQYLLVQPGEGYRFFDTSLLNGYGIPSKSFVALARWSQRMLASGGIARRPLISSPHTPAPAPPEGGAPPPPSEPPPGQSPPPEEPPPPPPPPPDEPPPPCILPPILPPGCAP
jgi:hypothetical protein